MRIDYQGLTSVETFISIPRSFRVWAPRWADKKWLGTINSLIKDQTKLSSSLTHYLFWCYSKNKSSRIYNFHNQANGLEAWPIDTWIIVSIPVLFLDVFQSRMLMHCYSLSLDGCSNYTQDHLEIPRESIVFPFKYEGIMDELRNNFVAHTHDLLQV